MIKIFLTLEAHLSMLTNLIVNSFFNGPPPYCPPLFCMSYPRRLNRAKMVWKHPHTLLCIHFFLFWDLITTSVFDRVMTAIADSGATAHFENGTPDPKKVGAIHTQTAHTIFAFCLCSCLTTTNRRSFCSMPDVCRRSYTCVDLWC